MTLTPPVSSGQKLIAATPGLAGFALQNGTPTILTWTAPNDGQMHRVTVFGMVHCTVAATGGAISSTFTVPDSSSSPTTQWNAGGYATGLTAVPGSTADRLIAPGTTYTLFQSSALTAGTVVFWAQLWVI